MLRGLFRPRPAVERGKALFAALAAQARRPAFYRDLGVADTVEGRFELYVLHLVFVLHRLKGEGTEAAEVSQATFDAFLRNLDEGLREMGVGDLSVGKKMRKLGEAVYGRIKGYDRVLAADASPEALEAMVSRTLLQGRVEGNAPALAAFVRTTTAALAAEPLERVLRADLDWPEPKVEIVHA